MKIIDTSTVSLEAARAWATQRGAHASFVAVAWHYWNVAPRYGIPPEVAYAQAAKETNWGKFTGVVPASYHNWCGLKTTKGGSNSDPKAHHKFPDDATGVLAHVQHLYRYTGAQKPVGDDEIVDPRWAAVTAFTQGVEGLGGAWAPSKTYGNEVATRVADLRSFANDGNWGGPPPEQGAQIPGFTWYPADADHYARGRTQKIRGGAQHYTAGTNSLNWLAKTSSPEVSVHFLVKHNPTMADRGWQLVKIENTAWTTAFANPYTVAIEYEHDGKQRIPDAAYEVLAQTWADITDYVRRNSLGDIEKVAGHKVWVANPSLICPDGIDVERIIKRWVELTATPEPAPPSDALHFPETGFSIAGGFRAYWEQFGGLPVYGYPITSAYEENGVRVQWFERARFEWHPGSWPERYDVLCGLLGVELLAARERIEELEETG